MTVLHIATTLEEAEAEVEVKAKKNEDKDSKKTTVSHSTQTNGRSRHHPHLRVDISASNVPITPTSTGCLPLSLHDLDPRLPRHVPIDIPMLDIYVLAKQAAEEQAVADTYHLATMASAAAAEEDSKDDQGDGTSKKDGQVARKPNAGVRHSSLAQIKARCIADYTGKKRFYSTQSRQSNSAHTATHTAAAVTSSLSIKGVPGQGFRGALSRPTAMADPVAVAQRRPPPGLALALALPHLRPHNAAPAPALARAPAMAYRGASLVRRWVTWTSGLSFRHLR